MEAWDYFNKPSLRSAHDNNVSSVVKVIKKLSKRQKIFVCPLFVHMCLARGDVDKIRREYGIKLSDMFYAPLSDPPYAFVYFQNYTDWSASFQPYPDICFIREFVSATNFIGSRDKPSQLVDIGLNESIDEIKLRVRSWVFDQVIPLYIEHLFLGHG